MFQADAMRPWRSALENVLAGLEYAGIDRKEATERAMQWLARVGLRGFEKTYPHHLLGGMRKRVALAQMLIMDPKLILMDNPFSGLNIIIRQLMEHDLLHRWSAAHKPVLFPPHDLNEAI